MRYKFFDFEVYPEWWLCVVGEYSDDLNESIKETFDVIHSDMQNARSILMQIMQESGVVFSGYNIKRYDLIILNAVYNAFTPGEIKMINDLIISPGTVPYNKNTQSLSRVAKTRYRKSNFLYFDLMDDIKGSLKQKEMLLGLEIDECNVPFDKVNLTEEDKQNIIKYCKHDVYASMYFFKNVKQSYHDAKMLVSKAFNVSAQDCMKSTNAQLCGIVLDAKRTSYHDEYDEQLFVPNRLRNYVYDNLPTTVIQKLMSQTGGFTVKLFENDVSFGNGGLHSTMRDELYVESNDEYTIVNMDVTSFYPSILIHYDTLSRSCRHKERFKEIFDTRVQLKRKQNLTDYENDLQKAYKIILNTAYGASKNKWLDMYDMYKGSECCRLGQLILASFAARLYKSVPNIKIIQTNTDGVCVYYPRANQRYVDACVKEFSDVTSFALESEVIQKMWQRDVNNYMWINEKGKRITKGKWLNTQALYPGRTDMFALDCYVCSHAGINWLLNRKNIVSTIVENDCVNDFCLSCVKGGTFSEVVQTHALGEIVVNNYNRVIATKNDKLGGLYKVKNVGGQRRLYKMPGSPDNCLLVNKDIGSYSFSDIQHEIDYMWYIQKAADLLDINWHTIKNDQIVKTNEFDVSF